MTPADISSSPLIQSPAFVFKKVRWRLAAGWPLRLAALLTAILIYGAFSSPTPEALGPAEIAVGMLLFMAAGGPRVMAVFWQRPRAGWARAGQALLFYGLSVPVIVGLFSGSTAVAMVRDVIPFLFMLLPLFLQSLVPRQVERRQEITIAVMLAGLGFAARVVKTAAQAGWAGFWHPSSLLDPTYLANAPTVLFTALLLIGLAGREIYLGTGAAHLRRAVLFFALSLIPLTATILVSQRASVGVVILYAAYFLFWGLRRRPWRAIIPLVLLTVLIVAAWPVVGEILHSMLQKTQAVGINARGLEAMAVFNRMTGSSLAVLFGRGWGASIASPAVGGLTVNFTHSLLTTYWLKTGLCGLVLVLYYLYRLARLLTPIARTYPLLAGAMALPLAIDVTLYATFKSLDFGLMLLLLTVWAQAERRPPSPGLS